MFKPEEHGALCPQCPLKNGIPVPHEVHKNARLVVVVDGPGHEDEVAGRPLYGASGQLIEHIGSAVGFTRSDLTLCNATACWMSDTLGKKQKLEALACCAPYLKHAIDETPKAKVILALGQRAMYATTGRKEGIFTWQGGPLPSINKTHTVIPALAPNHVLRDDGRQWMPVQMTHVQRAWGLATGLIKPFKWPEYYIEPDADMVAALRQMAKGKLTVAFDTETMGINPMRAPVMCLSLATTKVAVSIPWHPYRQFNGLTHYSEGREIEALVRQILTDPKITKALHNAWYDILAMKYDKGPFGDGPIIFAGPIFDTLLAHHVVAPPLRHGLDTVACIYLNGERWKDHFDLLKKKAKRITGNPFADVHEFDLRCYNAKDSMATALLVDPLIQELKDTHKGMVQFTALTERTAIAAGMQERGVPVDTSKFKGHIKNLKARRAVPLADLRKMSFRLLAKEKKEEGRARAFIQQGIKAFPTTHIPPYKYASAKLGWPLFNPRSQHHVKHMFGIQLAAPIYKRSIKTGAPSFNDVVLEKLLGYPDPMISYAAGHILRFRKYDKLVGFLEKRRINGVPIIQGKAHSNWKTYGTRTGRWSSPLMIIPKKLRDIFVPFPGHSIVEADFKALEAHIIALLAGDAEWLEILNQGGDVHVDTARKIFKGAMADKATRPELFKKQRSIAKMVNYAVQYRVGDDKLQGSLLSMMPGVSIDDVVRIKKEVRRPMIEKYHERTLKAAYENDFIEMALSGLRYYFYGTVQPTDVANNPIQGFGADLINGCIGQINKDLGAIEACILFQVHDALVISTPDVTAGAAILKKNMEQSVTINGHTAHFKVDIEWGNNWRDKEKVK